MELKFFPFNNLPRRKSNLKKSSIFRQPYWKTRPTENWHVFFFPPWIFKTNYILENFERKNCIRSPLIFLYKITPYPVLYRIHFDIYTREVRPNLKIFRFFPSVRNNFTRSLKKNLSRYKHFSTNIEKKRDFFGLLPNETKIEFLFPL